MVQKYRSPLPKSNGALFFAIAQNKGILFLLLAVMFWGPGPVFTKLALTEIPQFSLALIRGVISTTIVLILFAPRGYLKVKREDLPKMILAGLFGSVFNLMFFFFGIQRTTAISSQAIFTVSPVITTIFAILFLKEKVKPIQIMGVVIGLSGALLIATKEYFETGALNTGNLLGNFFIFLASLSWVGYILLSKNLSKTYSPITITSISIIVSLFAFIPLAIWENATRGFDWTSTVGIHGMWGAFYQGTFASLGAFLAYQSGLKLTSAFAAGVILYLNPIATTLFAVPILGEKITMLFVVGTLLVLAGSIIATQGELVRDHIGRKFRKK